MRMIHQSLSSIAISPVLQNGCVVWGMCVIGSSNESISIMSISDYSDYESARNTEGSLARSSRRTMNDPLDEIVEFSEHHVRKLSVDDALERVGTGKFQFYMLMIAGLAFSGDAIEVSLLTFLSPCVQSSWGLGNIDAASLASAVFGGAMVGSVVLGSAADNIGRRPVYFTSCILVLGFGIGSCFSLNFQSLVFTRGMVGFGIGGITSPFNLLAEILHPSERGQYLLYIEYFWCFGSFYTTLAAWLVLGSYGWRFLSALCALPAALSLLAGLWLPESPRWLLLHNCPNEAKEVIMQMARVNKTVDRLPAEWELVLGKVKKVDVNLLSYLKPLELLMSKEMRNRTFLIWIVWLAFGITYFGIILLIARIFGVGESDDDDDDESGTCTFKSLSVLVSSTSEVAGLTVVVFGIDSLGRRGSQLWLLLIGSISSLLIGLLTVFSFFARGSIQGASAATWVAIPELYPTNLRATGHSLATIVARIGAFASPYIVDSSLSISTLGIVFAIVNFVSCFAVLMLPETAGVSLDDDVWGTESMYSASALSFYRRHTISEDDTFSPIAAVPVEAAENEDQREVVGSDKGSVYEAEDDGMFLQKEHRVTFSEK